MNLVDVNHIALFIIFDFLTSIDKINLKRTCKFFSELFKSKEIKILTNIKFHYFDGYNGYINSTRKITEDEELEDFVYLTFVEKKRILALNMPDEEENTSYLCPDKVKSNENYIVALSDVELNVWKKKDGLLMLSFLNNPVDFDICCNYLYILTNKFLYIYELKEELILINVFCSQKKEAAENIIVVKDYVICVFPETVIIVKKLREEIIIEDKDFYTVKFYEDNLYFFSVSCNTTRVYSIKEEKFIKEFPSTFNGLYIENITISNGYIYRLEEDMGDNKLKLIIQTIEGEMKWKITLPIYFSSNLFVCPKDKKIIVSSLEGVCII